MTPKTPSYAASWLERGGEVAPADASRTESKATRRLQRRVRGALAEVEELRARIVQLEQDIQESRQLNKRLAEVIDVVSEVLLPAGQRDDERLRDLLANYDKAF
jgi:hypothetical protein